jgi:hypothetical protein
MVCNDPPTAGAFNPLSTISPGLRWTLTDLPQFQQRATILRNNGSSLHDFIIVLPAGDAIDVLDAGPDYLVVVRKRGADSYYLSGETYVVTAQGTDFREVWILNTKHPRPNSETEKDDVIPGASSFDVRDTETVSVFASPSPDRQIIAVVGHRLAPRYTFIRFYNAFNQDRILNDTSLVEVKAGGVFTANMTFNTATCTGTLSWQINNPGTTDDRSGSGNFDWPPGL